jgi:hypothetical protein
MTGTRRNSTVLALAGSLLMFSGATHSATQTSESDGGASNQSPALSTTAATLAPAPLEDEKKATVAEPTAQASALKSRVEERWQAMLARDYDKAYAYASPAYRKVFSKRQYLSDYAEQIRRDKVEVLKIEFTDDKQKHARVRVLIHYTTVINDNLAHLTGGIWEYWAIEEGQWWHVPKQ